MTEVILMLLELSLVMTSVQTAAALVSIVQQSVGEGSFEVIGSCKERTFEYHLAFAMIMWVFFIILLLWVRMFCFCLSFSFSFFFLI